MASPPKLYRDMNNFEFQSAVKEILIGHSHKRYRFRPRQSEIDEENAYDFDMSRNRGLAIIISNENFSLPKFKKRECSHSDAFALMRDFTSELGFHAEVFEDLTASQMILLAKEAARSYPHENADCFVFVVSTHGNEDRCEQNNTTIVRDMLYGYDCDSVNGRQLVECFTNEYCPTLSGKPRLFFIKACRGTKLDHGVTIGEAKGGDAGGPIVSQPTSKEPDESISMSIHPVMLYQDCLVMYSTPPGYGSWRNFPFFKELGKLVKREDIDNISFLQGLIWVSGQVAVNFNSDGSKTMPVIDTMLLKDIFMRKRQKEMGADTLYSLHIST